MLSVFIDPNLFQFDRVHASIDTNQSSTRKPLASQSVSLNSRGLGHNASLDVPIGTKVEGTLGEALDAEKRFVYCGSGVAACVKFFSLALIGKNNVTL